MSPEKRLESFDGIIEKLDISGPQAARESGPLAGLSFSVKDNFAIAGHTSGFGNPDWQASHDPAQTHAQALQACLQAGAHLTANTCCDELTFSLDGINKHFGTPLNSQYPNRIPGGSSSGSAASVGAGLVDFSLGSDTAGSVRVPASFCGLWGFRPSHGAISTRGVLPLGPSFDTVGVLAREADVLARAVKVLLHDQRSGAAETRSEAPQSAPPEEPVITRLVVPEQCWQILSESPFADMMAHMVSAKEKVKGHLNIDSEEDLTVLGQEQPEDMVHNFNLMRSYEAWQCHGAWLEETRPSPYLSLDSAIAARLRGCKETTYDQFQRASAVRRQLQELIRPLFDGSTLICLPTTWSLPPYKDSDSTTFLLHRSKNMQLSALASFLGLPQISMPMGVGRGKLGLSLIAGHGQDSLLLCKSVLTIGHN